MTLDASRQTSSGPLALASTPLAETDGLRGVLTALAAPPDPSALVDRTGLLMISIKNRQFTTPLIDGFCRFAIRHLRAGCITVVDRPYIQNVFAGASDGTQSAQIEGLRRLANERTQQVRRILRRYNHGKIELVAWDVLARQTPDWITTEILAAWDRRGSFYVDLIEQARGRVGAEPDTSALEQWAQFLVEETPVLVHCYYLAFGPVVDCYPGALPEYLWRIERGDYAAELPRVSALARAQSHLVYADVRC